MFVDKAKIRIIAGNGGNGAVAFHREKYVAAGGPDGGDGGRGGNVVFQVDDNISTLADFRYKRKYKAPNGENGRGSHCNGKKGEDGYTPVRGTDYWTEADKAEIKSYVDEAILGGSW